MDNSEARFVFVDGFYWPDNVNAAKVSHILSKRKLRESDMIIVRSKGYAPTLRDGTEIGRVDINA